MAPNLTIRRLAAAVTVSGCTVLILAAPAQAKPDWGERTSTDGSSTIVREVTVPVDDNSLELLQIGLGALAGIGVAGAGAAAINARQNRRRPQPA